MFIVITKKRFRVVLLAVSAALLLAAFILLLKSFDSLMIHRNMPKPKPASDNWSYKSVFIPFKPAKAGYSAFVDLDCLTVTLYHDGDKVKSWPVSGGAKESPSPTGSWAVTDIDNWGTEFGGSWIALNVPWGQYGIHGTVEPWAVGSSNISHGCIRMKNPDVAELKKYMSKGIPVHIKHDKAPFRELMDGKVGSDVVMLQVMLKKLGYYDGTPDGRFAGSTFKALCQFQQDERINVDGVLGLQSWKLLQKRAGSKK